MTDTFRNHDYDGAAPRPTGPAATLTHAAAARTVAAAQGLATLATLTPDGHPFASVVQYVLDDDGQPVTLISEIAEHTKHVRRDPRASVIVAATAQPGDDPMALALDNCTKQGAGACRLYAVNERVVWNATATQTADNDNPQHDADTRALASR